MMDLLTSKIAEILDTLIAQGFIIPLYCVIVSNDGSIMGVHYNPAQDGTLVAKLVVNYSVKGMITFPANIMFVDSTGNAARVILEESGNHQIFH
jgi:hypothetical protein